MGVIGRAMKRRSIQKREVYEMHYTFNTCGSLQATWIPNILNYATLKHVWNQSCTMIY